MDLNRSEESRRTGLAVSLGHVAACTRPTSLRIRELNPAHLRTPEDIRRECDHYRREAYRAWGFPYPP